MKLNFKKPKFSRFFKAAVIGSLTLGAFSTTSCIEEINPKREVRDYGTFGTELYNILYDNSVYSKDHSSQAFLTTLSSHRDDFINAVDTTAIPDDLDELNQVFINIVPLYENMLYPGTLRKAAVVMGELAADPAAVNAMAWLSISPNLLLAPEHANPIGLFFQYDDLVGITDELLTLLLNNSVSGQNATNQLIKEISIAAKNLEENSDPKWFVRRVVDLMLTENDVYGPKVSAEPQTAARLDTFGNAVIREEMKSSIAATLDEMGYYNLADGSSIAPFEITGTPAGFSLVGGQTYFQDKPVFETFDLQKTPLAYLIREGDTLLENDTLDEALRAVKSLLGTPHAYADENGAYTGYERNTGVAQLTAALFSTLDHDSVGPNFEAISQLLENNRDVVARLVYDLDVILDIIDETPSNFSADNNLIDRLLPELLDLAKEPGMLEDLFMALDDPIAAHIAPQLSELAQRKTDFISLPENSKYDACFQACNEKFDVGTFDRMNCIRECPRDEILGTERADHNAPESFKNRSLFQRTTHLMWETSQTPYEVHTEKVEVMGNDLTDIASSIGPLITFDNLAEAYLLTITGDLHLVEHLSNTFIDLASIIGDDGTTVAQFLTHLTDNLFGLKLSIHPTTAEVTRMFNMPAISSISEKYRLDLNTANCRSGIKCLESNADVLFAIEAVGLVDSMHPLLKVFSKHKKTHVLARIVSILFEYYPSQSVTYLDAEGKPLDLQPSDFRSLEPVLIRALDETNVVADVGSFGDALLDVKLKDGTVLAARFEDFVEYLLTPDKTLRKLDGSEYTKDPSGNFIAPIPPAYLYIDALRDISDFLDEHEETKTQLSNALEGISKITIKTVKQSDGTIVFEKPAGIQLVADLVRLLEELFEDITADGSRKSWIRDEAIPEVDDIFSGRLVYAFFQLFAELDARPNGLNKFRRLILHLMETGSETPTHLTGAGYLLGDMLLNDVHLTALSHVISSPLDPDRVWTTEGFSELSLIVTLLTCVDAFNECDPGHSFDRVFYRLFETNTRKRANIFRILDVGSDLFRQEPGSPNRRTAADMKIYLDFAHDLFTDDVRGVERIYGVIDFTIWGNDRRPKDWKPEDASWQIQFGSDSTPTTQE